MDRPMTVVELVAQEWQWKQVPGDSGAGGRGEAEGEFVYGDIALSSFVVDSNSYEFDSNQPMSTSSLHLSSLPSLPPLSSRLP
jgi:hypothetical protein